MRPSYSWDAADYAAHSRAQLLWAQELISKLALTGNESVLDVGCGDGKATVEIGMLVPSGRVVGIDNSWGMVSLARSRFSPSDHSNLSFLCMDATALCFHGGFDVAFSNAVLHWVRDHLAVLRGVRRALRPGGRLLFQMGGQGNAAWIVALFGAMLDRKAWRDYFRGFRFPYCFHAPEDYAAWLPRTGFRLLRADLAIKDMQHEGADALAGWIRTTWLPYLERIPPERREEFIQEAVAAFLGARPPDENGVIHLDMVRLEVEAAAL